MQRLSSRSRSYIFKENGLIGYHTLRRKSIFDPEQYRKDKKWAVGRRKKVFDRLILERKEFTPNDERKLLKVYSVHELSNYFKHRRKTNGKFGAKKGGRWG